MKLFFHDIATDELTKAMSKEGAVELAYKRLEKEYGTNHVKRVKTPDKDVATFLVMRLNGRWYQATYETGAVSVEVHEDWSEETAEELLRKMQAARNARLELTEKLEGSAGWKRVN